MDSISIYNYKYTDLIQNLYLLLPFLCASRMFFFFSSSLLGDCALKMQNIQLLTKNYHVHMN